MNKFIKIAHLSYKDLSHSGRLERLLCVPDPIIKHTSFLLDSLNTRHFFYSNNLAKYNLLVVHNSLEILREVCEFRELQRVVYFPHSNLVGQQARELWKSIVHESHIEIHVIVGSRRALLGFPIFGTNKVIGWISPTFGISEKYFRRLRADLSYQFSIGYFGRLDPDKSVHEILGISCQVAKEFGQNISIALAGKESNYCGAYFSRYLKEEWTKQKNVNLSILGWIDERDFYGVMQQCRLVIIPGASIWETWCSVAWEALALGIPVVGPNWDGIGEAIKAVSTIEPIPVIRSGLGFRGTPSELSSLDWYQTKDFNGYKLDINKTIKVILDILTNDNTYVDCESAIQHANINICRGLLKAIAAGRYSTEYIPPDFSNDLEHLCEADYA
jgi:glycosyltransferase involved in cell wall biosynthesis